MVRKNVSVDTTITQFFKKVKRVTRVPASVKQKIENKKIEKCLLENVDPEGFKIIETKDKGRGIVTLDKIIKGNFVMEYAGDLIKISEAKNRERDYEKASAGSYMYFFHYNNRRYCIDATKPTNRLGRLINHSRKVPNLKTKVYSIDNVPRLILLALRDIEPGEELLYDYGEKDKDTIAANPWIVDS